MASRDLNDLHPDLFPLAIKFRMLADLEDIQFIVTCTYRSAEEQNKLYAQGRTSPGPRVTNAKGGQSLHNFSINGKPASKAFDIVPIDEEGKALWSTTGKAGKIWARLGELGREVGLEWGGDWKSLKDYPHFQLKGA